MSLCSTTFAQKGSFAIGFRIGTKAEGFEKTNVSGLKIVSPFGNIASPTIGMNLAYSINDRVSIISGIGFLEYYLWWGMYPDWDKIPDWSVHGRKKPHYKGSQMYKPVQIPLSLKYAFPLGKSSFNIYGKLGLQFDILTTRENDARSWSTWIPYPDTNYLFESDYTISVYKKMNILLNMGIGLEYRLKNGLGLSFEGEYYTGMRVVGEIDINSRLFGMSENGHIYTEITKEYTDRLLIKGNYWNFSLGISYNFKKKKKEINKNTIK